MKIFLFRHGEKESHFTDDPELTVRGKAQAQQILKWVQTQSLPTPTAVYASTALRAQQTLQPICDFMDTTLTIDPDLAQRNYHESSLVFMQRIKKFFLSLQKNHTDQDIVFLASHIDWLLEALDFLQHRKSVQSWSPGMYMEFNWSSNGYIFIKEQQTPPAYKTD